MFAKVVWKAALFSLSIFMLLLTMGYGHSGGSFLPKQDSHIRLSGQAKIAAPGARTSGFKSVAPPPEAVVVEPSIFAKIRNTTDRWITGDSTSGMVAVRAPERSELQQLQRRRDTYGVPGGMSVMKAY